MFSVRAGGSRPGMFSQVSVRALLGPGVQKGPECFYTRRRPPDPLMTENGSIGFIIYDMRQTLVLPG